METGLAGHQPRASEYMRNRIRMVHLHAEPRATCRPCMSSSELSSFPDRMAAATDGLSRRGCTIASIALPSRRHVPHVADVELRAHHVVFRRLVQLLQCAHLCTSTKRVSWDLRAGGPTLVSLPTPLLIKGKTHLRAQFDISRCVAINSGLLHCCSLWNISTVSY